MTTPTAPTPSESPRPFTPYRLEIGAGPSWLNPGEGGETLPGFALQGRLGHSFSLTSSGNVAWALNGVFEYDRYFKRDESLTRIGFGLETGPEFNLVSDYLAFALYGGLYQRFYHSDGIAWGGATRHATFNNEHAISLSLHPRLLFLGGLLSLDFEWSRDTGIQFPGPTRWDAPSLSNPDVFSAFLMVNPLGIHHRSHGVSLPPLSADAFFRGIRFSSSVESTYTYSFNEPAQGPGGLHGYNAYRTNTAVHNRLRLNTVAVELERPSDEASLFGFALRALVLGSDAGVFAPRSSVLEPIHGARDNPDTPYREDQDTQYFALREAYVTYQIARMTLQAGQFGTLVGNEVPMGLANTFLIPSRGFLNTLAEPFYHAGVNSIWQLHPEWKLHLGVVNGWDSVLGHEGGPTVHTGLVYDDSDRFAWGIYYLIDPLQGAPGLLNMNLTYRPSGSSGPWTLGVNLDLGHGKDAESGDRTLWFGLGTYEQYSPVAWWDLVLRQEIFTDPHGARTGTPQTLASLTLASNFIIPAGPTNFFAGPEIRHDRSFGREEGAEAPFARGRGFADSNTTFTLRAGWRY